MWRSTETTEFYDCFVNHSSLAETTVVEWAGNCSDCETESKGALKAELTSVPVVPVVLVVLALIVIGFCIYTRKRFNGQMSSYDDENRVKMSLNSDCGNMSSPESKRKEGYNKISDEVKSSDILYRKVC